MNNEIEKIIKDNKYVLIDLYADWCGPCKMLSPIVEELSKEEKDVVFNKVNVDENGEIAAKYEVISIPTLLFFKDGELKSRTVGFMSKEELKEFIEQNK